MKVMEHWILTTNTCRRRAWTLLFDQVSSAHFASYWFGKAAEAQHWHRWRYQRAWKKWRFWERGKPVCGKLISGRTAPNRGWTVLHDPSWPSWQVPCHTVWHPQVSCCCQIRLRNNLFLSMNVFSYFQPERHGKGISPTWKGGNIQVAEPRCHYRKHCMLKLLAKGEGGW